MIKIFSPANESELAVARSILEAEDIPHYIQNEHFGSLYSGVMIKNFNAKVIFVPEEYEIETRSLLSNFDLEPINIEKNDQNNPTSNKSKIRIFLEAILFGK